MSRRERLALILFLSAVLLMQWIAVGGIIELAIKNGGVLTSIAAVTVTCAGIAATLFVGPFLIDVMKGGEG